MSKHLSAIVASQVTKTNVIGIRKALNTDWRRKRGYSVSRSAPKLQGEALDDVLRALSDRRPIVRGDLHASGVRLLTDKRWRKRWSASAARVIADMRHISLVGFTDVAQGAYIPVYEVSAPCGSFRYYHLPWQTAWAYGLEGGPHELTAREEEFSAWATRESE